MPIPLKIGLDQQLDTIRDVLANVPASSIAQLDAIVAEALPEKLAAVSPSGRRGGGAAARARRGRGPQRRRPPARKTASVAEPNRLGVVIEIASAQGFLTPSVTLNLTEFTEFFGIPTPEIPPSANLDLNLNGAVQSRMATIILSADQNGCAQGQCARDGARPRVCAFRMPMAKPLAIGVIRSVDFQNDSGVAVDFASNADKFVYEIEWDRDFDESAAYQITHVFLDNARQVASSDGVKFQKGR